VDVNQTVNPPEIVKCSRCVEPALDDSEFCAACREVRRAAYRLSRRKSRKRNRKAGKCADCPNPSKSYQCVVCALKSGRAPRAVNRAVNRKAGGVKLEVGRDGATRTRNVPRFGQGGPTRDETDRGLLRDLKDGLARLSRVTSQWPPPRELIDALPRVQRVEAWDRFVEPFAYAMRMSSSVVLSLPTSWARDKVCACCGQGLPGEDE